MTSKKQNNKCRTIRTWLVRALSNRLGFDANWIQNHIADCPKCQRRLAALGKVDLALSIIKSQPLKLDLLMRANTQAVNVLKHSLRHAPKAQRLKTARPEPKLLERCAKYAHPAANVAACITIMLLMKVGIFTSVDKFHTEGRKVVKQYYTTRLGQDLSDEIFSS